MPKIQYKEINFRGKSLELINLVNQVINEYKNQGYELTLRQTYYQLVARGYIPNNERSYKNIGNLINDGRLAGLIDWYSIVDRTRNLRGNSHWDKPEDVIASARYSYLLNKWDGQPNYVEVWVEKDALVDIVGQACIPLDTPYFSCRGYTSQSEMWSAAQHLERNIKRFLRKIVAVCIDEINQQNGTDYQITDVYFEFTHEVMSNEQENEQNELTEAQKQQVQINTLLSLAQIFGDDLTIQYICDVLDIDYEDVKDKLPDNEADKVQQVQDDLDSIIPDDEGGGIGEQSTEGSAASTA